MGKQGGHGSNLQQRKAEKNPNVCKMPPEFQAAAKDVEEALLALKPPQVHGPAQARTLQWHCGLERRWGDYRDFLERSCMFVTVTCPGGTFCAFPRKGLSVEWALELDRWFTNKLETARTKQQNNWRRAGAAAKKLFMEAFGNTTRKMDSEPNVHFELQDAASATCHGGTARPVSLSATDSHTGLDLQVHKACA